jgi:hypothetical protein
MISWNPQRSRLALTSLAPGKGEQLSGQLCAPIGGMLGRRGKPLDLPAIRGTFFDQLEVPANHREEVVKIVGDPTGELADSFHLLALMKLLLHKAARLHRLLLLGDVAEVDRETSVGGKRIESVPSIVARTGCFK